MSALTLCALCLTIAGLALSSLASPGREETGQSADLPNLDSKDVVILQQQLSLMTRLAELEERVERKESEWREEREDLRAALRRLEDDNQRLEKMFKQKTCKDGTFKNHAQQHNEANHPQEKPESGATSLQQPERTRPQLQQRQHLVARSDDTDGLEPVVNQLSQRLGEVGADVEALKNVNAQQDLRIQQAGTSTFVRWGRSVCPPSAELVYAGVVGGADYRDHGASTSVLCLPLDPVFGSVVKSQFYAELWGAEYQTHGSSPAHNNMDPVCAVCRTPRPTSIMVPAKNACGDGWVLEYSGYLMGSYPPHAGGHQFLCMDSALEDRVGSESDQEGLLMYLTFARCHGTSLPCPPYQQDKVITCAVCSK